jgi:hypothetical protein
MGKDHVCNGKHGQKALIQLSDRKQKIVDFQIVLKTV